MTNKICEGISVCNLEETDSTYSAQTDEYTDVSTFDTVIPGRNLQTETMYFRSIQCQTLYTLHLLTPVLRATPLPPEVFMIFCTGYDVCSTGRYHDSTHVPDSEERNMWQ